jgi:hypothetical protein
MKSIEIDTLFGHKPVQIDFSAPMGNLGRRYDDLKYWESKEILLSCHHIKATKNENAFTAVVAIDEMD